MKTAKATVTALLYTSKTLANGEHPVMIRVCYNGRRKYKSTGLSCPSRLWNAAKQEVRGRHPLSVNMNALIESELTPGNLIIGNGIIIYFIIGHTI